MFRRSMTTTTHYAWKDVPYTAQRHAKQTLVRGAGALEVT
jgi:hypothetical protein